MATAYSDKGEDLAHRDAEIEAGAFHQRPAVSGQLGLRRTLVAVSIEPPDGYWFSVAFHCHLAQLSCCSGGGAQRCHH